MPRVVSQKVRQMLLVTGDPLNPLELPEKVQLYNELGQVVDVTQDPSKMQWAGVWDIDTAYTWNDVVMDSDVLYILTNPSGVPAGDPRPTESESGDWFLLTVAPPPPPPAFMGLWSVDESYLAGAIVSHGGSGWATTEDVENLEPGVPTGANWQAPIQGLQARTTDKIDDGVLKTIDFNSDSSIGSSDGERQAIIAVDFAGASADIHLLVHNRANRAITVGFYSPSGTWQSGAGITDGGSVDVGQTKDLVIRHATFYGYDDSMYRISGAPDIVGSVDFTFTGASMVPPDLSNPWLPL